MLERVATLCNGCKPDARMIPERLVRERNAAVGAPILHGRLVRMLERVATLRYGRKHDARILLERLVHLLERQGPCSHRRKIIFRESHAPILLSVSPACLSARPYCFAAASTTPPKPS